VGFPGGGKREQSVQPVNGEPARGRRWRVPTQARSSNWHTPFDSWGEPHETDAAKAWLGRHPDQGKGAAVQGVRGVCHLYRIG